MGNLNKEIAVITGGAGAIGSSFAKALLNAGAKVVILDRGMSKSVSESAAEIEAETDKKNMIFGYKCDVTDENCMSEVFETISNLPMISTTINQKRT